MDLPSFRDHCRSIDADPLDKKPYILRYLEAKGWDENRYRELARLAFNLVQAEFRLNDISQTVATDNSQRLAAQQDEIVGWQNKVNRYTQGPVSISLYKEMVNDFRTMAAEARQLNEAERNFMALGLEGRIGEVVTEPAKEGQYSWQLESSGKGDSAFAG